MRKVPFRSIFIAPKDYEFVAFDFSAAESWVVAYLSQSETMREALQSGDFHKATATALFNKSSEQITKDERYLGKRCNHAFAYRMSPFKLAEVVNSDVDTPHISISFGQAKKLHALWHSHYMLQGWWRNIENELSNKRYLITPYGRKRHFFLPWGNELFKEATAFVPQSTVGDHTLGKTQPHKPIRGGCLEVRELLQREKSLGTRLVHTAHDSIMLEVPKSNVETIIELVYPILHRPIEIHGEDLWIPVDCERGAVWGQLEKVKLAS